MFDPATKAILRRVLAAMWSAERELRSILPRPALPFENQALKGIKELQQADRIYLHKTAFVPPPLKEEKRMTGELKDALSFTRAQGEAPQVIAAEVRVLLQALAREDALPALWNKRALDAIRTHISNDDQRLDAQRAVQDVADGCVKCRAVLRAWLRGAVQDAPVLLQPGMQATTPFTQAWNKESRR